jgi:DNA-binding transcriptional LysR family regulator
MQGPSWDGLRYLLLLRRAGSLAGAALQLGVDQTTVGRRLEALERETGARLLVRGVAGTTLTDAGARVCALAEQMESTVGGIETAVAEETRVSGTVRITTAAGFVPILAPALAELGERNAGLRFEFLVGSHKLNLVQREADIAVRMTRDNQSSLLCKRLGGTPWGLYASVAYLRRHGALGEALRGHEVIGFAPPLTRTPGGVWLAEHARGANVVAVVDNVLTGIALAAEGMGLVAAPRFMAREAPSLGLALDDTLGESEVFVLAHPELASVPRVRVTLDALEAHVRSQAWRLAG